MAESNLTGTSSHRFFLTLLCVLGIAATKGLVPVTTPLQFWARDLAYFVVLPAVSAAILCRVARKPFRQLFSPVLEGKPEVSIATQIGAAFVMAVLLMWCIAFVAVLMAWLPEVFARVMPAQVSYKKIVSESGRLRALVLVYFALSAALVEEYLCRGLMGRYFLERPRPRPLLFVVVSSALFAALHWSVGLGSILLALAEGIIAATVVVYLRRLLPVIAVHFLVDILTFG